MKKLISLLLALAMLVTLTAVSAAAEKTEFKIGICNFVKDASLDQIVENIKAQFDLIAEEKGVTFQILEDNCMADAAVMEQIIADFLAEEVDLMIGDMAPNPAATLDPTLTAANFGNLSEDATHADLAAGIVNLVLQAIGTMTVLASQCCDSRTVILTGSMTTLTQAKPNFENFERLYGIHYIIPENATFATAIGAALCSLRDCPE